MKKLTRRQLIKRGLALAGGVLLTDALFIEPEWIAVRHLKFKVKDLPVAFEGYRIGLFADVHFPRNISSSYVRRASETLMAAKPDLVVLPGDFVDGKHVSTVPSFRGIYDALDTAPDGVYGVLGNHDHWFDEEGTRKELSASTPIKLIENTHVLIERGGGAIALGRRRELSCACVR